MGSLSEDAVDLAQGLIRCKSVTPEEGGALDYLQGKLEAAGFTCHRLPFEAAGTPTVDNLYARIGTGRPHLCFAGHTDVVPPGDDDAWTHPPFAGDIDQGLLYGRGAADMKGGVAAFAAAAFDYLTFARGEPAGSISLLITGDEEGPAVNGTEKVLKWMEAHDEVLDHAIVGEPTNATQLGETIKIGRRGSLNGKVTVKGVQGHVAYPALANNPIRGLIAVLSSLYEEPLDHGNAHFAPSNLEVTTIDVRNPATNVIPAKAEALFNIRFNDDHTPDSLQSWAREKAFMALEGSGLEAIFDYEPANPVFVTEPGTLSTLLSEAISDVTGLTPELSTAGGTSDARFIKDYCPVVEFGLTTETMHQVDERVSLSDLEKLAVIYRRFLDLYFNGGTAS
ncbi:succinyl-diaminopimelate desuccinylase [Methyloligella solikamskensis]|uniref:Succinyl-diaminopimelate desuccinylase n=1 Tax=Methyloligella solikamskensis TaxID=1177756 RepID=A0ABW3JCH8_9HYPH